MEEHCALEECRAWHLLERDDACEVRGKKSGKVKEEGGVPSSFKYEAIDDFISRKQREESRIAYQAKHG